MACPLEGDFDDQYSPACWSADTGGRCAMSFAEMLQMLILVARFYASDSAEKLEDSSLKQKVDCMDKMAGAHDLPSTEGFRAAVKAAHTNVQKGTDYGDAALLSKLADSAIQDMGTFQHQAPACEEDTTPAPHVAAFKEETPPAPPAVDDVLVPQALPTFADEAGELGEREEWWIEELAKIFGMCFEWVRSRMGKTPSVEEALGVLRLFEQIVHNNGATISAPKKAVGAKLRLVEVTLRILVEAQKIRNKRGAALADGGYFLVPGRDWDVLDEKAWVGALCLLMVHPQWPGTGNDRKTAKELKTKLEEIKKKNAVKPICELLWGLGFSVPPNVAPHTRKNKRKLDPVNTYTPEKKGDRALLHQTHWQWNEEPFRTQDKDGNMEFDQNDNVLLPGGAPLKKIWDKVRVVTRTQKAQKKDKRAKTAQ
ncbi:hypothetical protein T484DRAFT_1852353 [Baffinella frigidus]|nr:hypothetical protein T484DRAFT_1852353 [Cryptophyta sp. CCMP2293]